MRKLFANPASSIIERALDEAVELGSPTVEAEHLLLAIAVRGGGAAEILHRAGLTHDAILAALQHHTEATLAVVGVTETAFGAARPLRIDRGRLRIAASMRQALKRAGDTASERRARTMSPGNLLHAVLSPARGTVPRALALAGVDIEDLRARAKGAT
jgi:ATP-dependent Clp protease ATP-binding subunit ClpA